MNPSNDEENPKDFSIFAKDEPEDAQPFYEAEGELLALWDQLQEVRLERALLESAAQDDTPADESAGSDEEIMAQLKDAEKANLEARARYVLGQSIVEDVLAAGPTLNAIHAGEEATQTERDLRRLLDRRDILGIAATNQATQLRSARSELMKVEVENIRTRRKNEELERTLQSINEDIQSHRETVAKDPRFSMQIHEARKEAVAARRQWRLMKSVVSGVIAASGVDWAHDEGLTELVLDDEDERENE